MIEVPLYPTPPAEPDLTDSARLKDPIPTTYPHLKAETASVGALSAQNSRGGLVFKAHRRLYHSTLGLRVIKKKKKTAF